MGQSSRYGQDGRLAPLAIRSAVSSVVESLERRQLLSVNLSNGVLAINGGDGADNIQIRPGKPGHFRVNDNGQRHYFKSAEVKQIRFSGGAGDDVLIVQELGSAIDVDIVADGGAGDDVIAAGSGDDSLRGSTGDDLLVGGKGNSLLVGDDGDDSLLGREGNDRLFGRAGNDELHRAGGQDVAAGGEGDDRISSYVPQFPIIDSFSAEPTGYSVQQMRNGYGFADARGNTWTGKGQAIAIVGVFDLPTAKRDLDTFSREMGIPTLKGKQLRVINLAPKSRRLFDEGWNSEAMLDLQWAHAIAPEAKIYMVQAATNTGGDVEAAIKRATRILNNNHGGGVVSMSLGQLLDQNVNASSDGVFRGPANRHISFIAATGDTGGVAAFPAFSPNVTAVGGTTLYLDEFGNRVPGATQTITVVAGDDNLNPLNIGLPSWGGDLDNTAANIPGGERAWWDGSGGFTQVFPIPRYQQNRGIPGNQRGVPDVAWNADPRTGVSVYNSAGFGGTAGWATVGGTSAGAPQFAGLVAIVNQLRKKQKLRPVGSTLNERIYRLGGRGNDNYFNDITIDGNGASGANGPPFVNPAGAGWDPATGWGSPNAQALVPALVSDKISSGRPSGRPGLFNSMVRIRGQVTEEQNTGQTFDVFSFGGETPAAGSSTITVQAMTTTNIIRIGTGGPTTGLAVVDVFGQDESTGAGIANTWTFYEFGGNVVQRIINQGTGTPFTLVRNGDRVTGYAFITITDIPVDTMSGTPTPLGQDNDWVIRHAPVKFVGRVGGGGDISGEFFTIDTEGNKVKRDFGARLQSITIQGSIQDSD